MPRRPCLDPMDAWANRFPRSTRRLSGTIPRNAHGTPPSMCHPRQPASTVSPNKNVVLVISMTRRTDLLALTIRNPE